MNKTREDSSDRHNNNIEEPKLGIFVDGKRLDNVFVWVMGKKIWLVLRRRWFADFLMMQYCWQSETVAQIKKVRQRWNEEDLFTKLKLKLQPIAGNCVPGKIEIIRTNYFRNFWKIIFLSKWQTCSGIATYNMNMQIFLCNCVCKCVCLSHLKGGVCERSKEEREHGHNLCEAVLVLEREREREREV